MKAAHTLHNVRPDLQELFQLHFKMWHKKILSDPEKKDAAD